MTKPIAKKPTAKKPAAKPKAARKPAAKAAAAPPPEAPSTAASADPEPQGSAEAYAELLPEALGIPEAEVRPFRTEAAIIFHNVEAGLAAVEPHHAALARLPAPFSLALMKSVYPLALAVIYAAAQVDRTAPGTTRPLLARAAIVREVLLASAVALGKAGVVPEARVKRILAGRGPRDLAQDCVDLAQLFREFARAVQGKAPVTKAHIDEAASVGNQLLTVLKSARTKYRASGTVRSAVDARDRLWTLLARRYSEQLRLAGMWLWRDDVDAHVPPLLSAIVKKRKKAAKAPEAEAEKAPDTGASEAPGDAATAESPAAEQEAAAHPAGPSNGVSTAGPRGPAPDA